MVFPASGLDSKVTGCVPVGWLFLEVIGWDGEFEFVDVYVSGWVDVWDGDF